MACDRFIHKCKKKPERADMKMVLEDFFGAAAESAEWHEDRFFVRLSTRASFPFQRLEPGWPRSMMTASDDERWIEVWLDKNGKSVDVLTRQQDEYTDSLAAGLAAMIARYWQGELEED